MGTDAEYRKSLELLSNSRCPDHSAHTENAMDRLFPNWNPGRISPDGWDAIDREADSEYMACEGHDC